MPCFDRYVYALLGFILYLTLNYAQAQGRVLSDILDPYQQNTDLMYNAQAQKNIVGSPFHSDWGIGYYFNMEGKSSPRMLLKYNAFNDELYQKTEAGQEQIIPKSQVQSFSYLNPTENREERFVKIVLSGSTRTGVTYFKQCYAGKVKLWEKVRKTIEKANPSNSSNSGYGTMGETNDKFVYDNLLLIEFENQPIQFVEKNKKKMASLFGKYAPDIEVFMKKENIKLKNAPEEYIKIIQYYEKLLQKNMP